MAAERCYKAELKGTVTVITAVSHAFAPKLPVK